MTKPRPTKLTPRFYGPFVVISQIKNDVTCKHVNLGDIKVIHVSRLKIFHGTLDEATRVALVDKDQSFVNSIVAYKGDPFSRSFMEFEVHWSDDTFSWVPYSEDIASTVHFETFCRAHSELVVLLSDAKTAARLISTWKRQPVTDVRSGDIRYVLLRWFGSVIWYNSLPLPDLFRVRYVVRFEYRQNFPKRKYPIIDAFAPVFNTVYSVNTIFTQFYGNNPDLDPANNPSVVLVDAALLARYPFTL
jgi:hypothetical protein